MTTDNTGTAQAPTVEPAELPGEVRHGFISGMGRAWCCATNPGLGCGPVTHEPQSVEGPKGFPLYGPPDGQLASGSNARFAVLDAPTAPGGKPWCTHTVRPGQVLRVHQHLTAPHRTQRFAYWLTTPNWRTEMPLTRDMLELVCEIDWACPGGEGWRCHTPAPDTHHWVILPRNRTGHHVLLGAWDVGDTGNAFYQAVDLDFQPHRPASADSAENEAVAGDSREGSA